MSPMGQCCCQISGFWPRPSRASASTPTHQLTRRNSRVGRFGRWPNEAQGQCLEVLYDGGEVELVARAREAAQPQALEAVMRLQVREAHLDALALIARLEEGLGLHLATRHVAGILVKIT